MNHYFTNNENLKSEIKKINVSINDIDYYFYTDNGVFSKERLDYGTELLIKTFKYNNPQDKKILDAGCGCGPIGIYLSKLGFNVTASDVNKRALHLTKKALKEQNLNANVIESDSYTNINDKYDYIISNPPIKAGKKVLYDIIGGANDYLKKNGKLWVVIRKDKGALSLIKDMRNIYDKIDIVEKKKGYYIIVFDKK